MLYRIRWMGVLIVAVAMALLASCGPAAPTTADSGGLPTAEPGADLSTTMTPVEEPTLLVETNEATPGLDVPATTDLTATIGMVETTTGTVESATELPTMASTMTITDTMMAATPDAAATTDVGTTTSDTATAGAPTTQATTAITGTTTTGSTTGAATEIELSVEGTELAFSEESLTVPAGEEISVTLNNNSDSLQHNWVLVRGGDDVAEQVNQEAMQAPPFTPDENSPDVIAATEMLDPGASDTVTFTIDEPGTYTFLCTFPGHYQAGMEGTLTVE